MEGKGGKTLGYLSLLATSVLWGTTWVVTKMGVFEISALQMSGMRQFIAGALIVGFFMIAKRAGLPRQSQVKRLLTISILMFVIANSITAWALKFIPIGMAALIGALYPLNVVLIERFFYGKKEFNALTLTGFVIGLAGVGLVFYDQLKFQDISGFYLGLSMALIANLAWSVGTVLMVRDEIEMNPYYSLGWQLLIGSFFITIIGRMIHPAVPLNAISLKEWMLIGYLVLAGSIFAFMAFIYSMNVLPHAIASLFAYINPLIALLIAPFFFPAEKVTIPILLGSVVTLFGVFIVKYSLRKK